MNSVVINIKTDPVIKASAQKIVREMGLSLSSVLNAYLRQLVRTRRLDLEFTLPSKVETKYLREMEYARKHGKRYQSAEEMMSDIFKT